MKRNYQWKLFAIGQTISLFMVAFAQNGPYPGTSYSGRKQPAKQNYQYRSEEIRTAPNLPGVPDYPGKKLVFASGIYYPNFQGGQCYTLRYLAKDKPNQIIDYYRSSLPGYGWKFIEGQVGENTLAARTADKGQTLLLSLQATNRPGYTAELLLRYLQTKMPSITNHR